jgi:ATP-dependent DNA ligase
MGDRTRIIADFKNTPKSKLKVKIIDFFNEVCQRNLEGVVAKRKTGTYSNG